MKRKQVFKLLADGQVEEPHSALRVPPNEIPPRCHMLADAVLKCSLADHIRMMVPL
jgi:hypothetical protein